jgi:predicted nuclease with TOPRIM domain
MMGVAKMLWLANEQQSLVEQLDELQIKINFIQKTQEGLIKEREELQIRLDEAKKELKEMV